LVTLEAELQKLVDCLDQVSCKYSLVINVDKNDIACRILVQNKQLEQVDMFPYLGSLITRVVVIYEVVKYFSLNPYIGSF